MLSPAPSQDLSSSVSSSAQSPGPEYSFPDMSHCSPQSQSHNDFLVSPDMFLGESFSGFHPTSLDWSTGNHVNMSQLQTNPDPHFPDVQDLEFDDDSGFEDQITSYREDYNQRSFPGGSYVEASQSQHSFVSPSDEGVGECVGSVSSPTADTLHQLSDEDAEGEVEEDSVIVQPRARSETPYSTHAEDSEDDEEYEPTSTRKRKGATVHSPPAKRARVMKATKKTAAKVILPQNSGELFCSCCSRADFKDASTLTRHIKTMHQRPYVCVFSFAGCESTFASKNEWKRHVTTQHLCFHSWICRQGQCAKVARPLANYGAEFNRKDLFTQHLKRMHVPGSVKSGSKKAGRDWEEQIKYLQEHCKIEKRQAPEELRCCVEGCDAKFEGANCWDERMEHVGKHLDQASDKELAGKRVVVHQGRDELLVEWAIEQGIVVVKGGSYRFPRDGEGRGMKWKSG